MAAAKELRMPTIAKLRGTEDYKAWATGMSFWLKREKRWGYVTGRVPAEDWDPEVDEATLCDIGLMVDPSVYVLSVSKVLSNERGQSRCHLAGEKELLGSLVCMHLLNRLS